MSKINHDPRIKQAKQLIFDVIDEYQKMFISGIRPALSEKKISYQEALDAFSKLRGGNLFYPYLSSGIGKNGLVMLDDGSIKYDFINGIGAHWGHSSPDIISANLNAALQDTVMQGNLQQNQSSLSLSKRLCVLSNMDHCFLTTSGAMANENALKICFQNRFPAQRILAFERCFMGRTLALAQITDTAAYRTGLPPTLSVDYLPFYDENDHAGSIEKAMNVLNKYLLRYPNDYATMCFELIQGEGGYYSGHHEFFRSIMAKLKAHNIPILIDEIQTFGRTTSLFATQYFNLEHFVDIITIGKLSQVCATLYKSHLKPKPGLISQTFTGSTSAIETSLCILEHLTQGNFLGKQGQLAQLSEYFIQSLKMLEQKYPKKIQGPFGIGGMIAFTPLEGNKAIVLQILQRLFKEGVIGFLTGKHPTRIRFLPPFGCITKDDIDIVVSIIERVVCHGQYDS